MSEPKTVRCAWCSKARKLSAYDGNEMALLMDVCQWCRGVETRRTRGTAAPPSKWVRDAVEFLRESDQIEGILKKALQCEKKGETVFEL